MDLLKKLYKIYSKSGKTQPMQTFIVSYLKANKIDCVVDNGNIYVTKGEAESYPCVVAHMDQVQGDPGRLKIYQDNDTIFGWSCTHNSQWGLGADDKNGIWVALKCLLRYKVIKAVFFRDEECGCLGSEDADMQFFNDCRFVLQADRKGNADFIIDACGTQLCSNEFVNAINLESFGYHTEYGMMTDVMTLKEKGLNICCANISCGYYEPHTNNEYTSERDLRNCVHLFFHIIDTVTEVMPHEPLCYGYDFMEDRIEDMTADIYEELMYSTDEYASLDPQYLFEKFKLRFHAKDDYIKLAIEDALEYIQDEFCVNNCEEIVIS